VIEASREVGSGTVTGVGDDGRGTAGGIEAEGRVSNGVGAMGSGTTMGIGDENGGTADGVEAEGGDGAASREAAEAPREATSMARRRRGQETWAA
jgi:hypothetical protein